MVYAVPQMDSFNKFDIKFDDFIKDFTEEKFSPEFDCIYSRFIQ